MSKAGARRCRHPERSRGIPEEVTLKLSRRDPSTDARDDEVKFALPVFALYPIERFLACFKGAFELARLHCFQDFAKSWTRFHSQRDQIVSRNQRWRNDRLV